MQRRSRTILVPLTLAAILAGGLVMAQEPQATDAGKKAGPEDIGFTWGNDVPELVRRGNEGFKGEDFKAAEDFYRGAQLKNPGEAVAAFNIGLAEAKQGNHESAASEFNRALNLAGPDTGFRAKTQYNLGLSHLQQAMDALSPKDKKNPQATPSKKNREQAIGQALKAIDAFDATMKLEPGNQDAAVNKAKTQHLLQFAATPPPQNQQNQDNGEGSEGDGESQKQQDSQQPPQDQQQEQQDQSSQQDQQQQDKGEQEQQQAGEGQDEKQDQQAGQGEQEKQEEQDAQDGKAQQADKKEAEMTEEQARELLNILGDQQNVVLRKSRYPLTRPEPKKDW